MAGKGGLRSTSFRKGRSGNPKGRPKENADVKEAARAHTREAIDRLAFWMRSENAKASVSACTALLDRAWGKPTQPVSGDEDEAPIRVEVSDTEAARRIAFLLTKATNGDAA